MKSITWFGILAAAILGAVVGCARLERSEPMAKDSAPRAAVAKDAAGQPGAEKGAAVKDADAMPRKIIYTATIRLVVEEFAKAEQDLLQLVKSEKGYVINSEISGSPGTPRSGQWKVRIPVERFDSFRDDVIKLGKLERSSTDSQDVTDEYYDLEARIKNKKLEEARLLQHLEKSTGKLEDILAVEREISRVRGEIERQQGRLQLLAKLTAMTTLTIFLNERTGYVPPETESFGTTIGHTFHGSLEALLDFGKGLVLIVVAIAPWLLPLAVVGVPIGLVLRRRFRA